MKPYNVSGIITLGEVNNPVMVWIFFFFFFFSKEEERDKHEDVLGLRLRICEVVLAVVRVGLRELWLQLACSLCALGVKCRAL